MKYLIIDTETTNTLVDEDNKLDISSGLVYDVGLAIINEKGEIFEEHSLINADVFFNREIMATAYYADKIPTYWEQIKNGSRKISNTYKINRLIKELIKTYEVEAVIAHNAHFDITVLNTTLRYITKSKYRYFFPYGTEIYDTLKMARQTLGKADTYKKYCAENNYLTKKGQPKLTAEIIYRFLKNEPAFEESHTGLEDVKIEKEIFAYCMATNPNIEKRLYA